MVKTHHDSAVDERKRVAQWLVDARKAAGMTQAQAAHAISTTVTSVSRWETGIHPLTAEAFLALVRVYGAGKRLASLLVAQRVTGHDAQSRKVPPLPMLKPLAVTRRKKSSDEKEGGS
jgi:transcriptional regulator with XRE-family HTH domain